MKYSSLCHREEPQLCCDLFLGRLPRFLWSLAMTKWIASSFLLAMTVLLFIPVVASAQAQGISADLANVYKVNDPKAVDGDILVYDDTKGIIRASTPFANNLFGILESVPLMVFKTSSSQKGTPVVRTGTATVNVTTVNGAIFAGDYITSSSTPGKGQKATQAGNVIGVALSGYNGTREGKISVAMRIEYADMNNGRSLSRLLDSLGILAMQSKNNPNVASQFMKYVVAGFIVMLSFIISFVIFGRSIGKGIEAIGRNPLARKSIELSLMLNVAFTLCIVLIAVGIAYAIVRF